MLFTCNNNKKEWDMNTGKHMILFNKEGSFDRESLVALWAYQQDWNRLNKKSRTFEGIINQR